MPALTFRPASEFSSSDLAALFNRGYEGYFTPVKLGAAEFENMAATGDFDLAASCVGLDGQRPVAFAFLGVRGQHGWVGGMGVAAASRGYGHGRRAMECVISSARRVGVGTLDLEVLEQNVHAASIYEALGFRDRRPLDVWIREPGAAPESRGHAHNAAHPGRASQVTLAECLELHGRFHGERAPWQRDRDSLGHWGDRLSVLGLCDASRVRGWVIYRAMEGRLNIADLAARTSADVRPVSDALAALIAEHPDSTLMLVNLPAGDPFGAVLRELGATVKFRQREMTLAL
jgi:ribosomal protein S18 acetylase RimI-like enzyme